MNLLRVNVRKEGKMVNILASSTTLVGDKTLDVKLVENDGKERIVVMTTEGEVKEHMAVSKEGNNVVVRTGKGDVIIFPVNSFHPTRDDTHIYAKGKNFDITAVKSMMLGTGMSAEGIDKLISSLPRTRS